ncbi:epimerase [Chroococcidiopsis sp. CCALA 051]|uniref:NAD-dependent epimerase/dehydratase family protein n=1 Tax=Chroococcidiopsis sp. CCALA 051 TaxID=869949 RepID=UPI000D0CD50B|nr:NAD(P)-dependent oxidoreductase [Chroococcidiopsis sp. CCALA 051]MBE9018030.1 NAD(P)-dependent oxidoreductase [Chroococcidiopsidales cyanobacterium LEGE 13417]PSM47844.1 epimerase [Chroococcidiopsis sp. CCALA 051]
MRILVTGASGCIGHYISEILIQETDYELYLLVRNPQKLQVDITRPGVKVLQGDLANIEQFADLLKTIDIAVLVATVWGGEDTFEINVNKTIQLLNLLDPEKCQRVIYFSTASVLDRQNNLLKEAGTLGIDYIRSKYETLSRLPELAIAPKITVLFPTLVLGGDAQKPYSHLSAGLPDVAKWINIARFFKTEGSFHFIHGRDVAQVVKYLIKGSREQGAGSREEGQREKEGSTNYQLPITNYQLPTHYVLGQELLTANQLIEEICRYFNKKIYFRIPLYLSIANLFIVLFRIQMADWDRFCLQYRYFTYKNVVNPSSFGLPNYCPTFSDALKIHGIPRRKLDT